MKDTRISKAREMIILIIPTIQYGLLKIRRKIFHGFMIKIQHTITGMG